MGLDIQAHAIRFLGGLPHRQDVAIQFLARVAPNNEHLLYHPGFFRASTELAQFAHGFRVGDHKLRILPRASREFGDAILDQLLSLLDVRSAAGYDILRLEEVAMQQQAGELAEPDAFWRRTHDANLDQSPSQPNLTRITAPLAWAGQIVVRQRENPNRTELAWAPS